jgi:hypothetical protein
MIEVLSRRVLPAVLISDVVVLALLLRLLPSRAGTALRVSGWTIEVGSNITRKFRFPHSFTCYLLCVLWITLSPSGHLVRPLGHDLLNRNPYQFFIHQLYLLEDHEAEFLVLSCGLQQFMLHRGLLGRPCAVTLVLCTP